MNIINIVAGRHIPSLFLTRNKSYKCMLIPDPYDETSYLGELINDVGETVEIRVPKIEARLLVSDGGRYGF